jgi:hypothetical protein
VCPQPRAAAVSRARVGSGVRAQPGSAPRVASAGCGRVGAWWAEHRACLPEVCRWPAGGRHARDAPRVPAGRLRGASRFAAWPWVVASGELGRQPAEVAAALAVWPREAAGAAELPAWPAAAGELHAEAAAGALHAAVVAGALHAVVVAEAQPAWPGAAEEPAAWLPEAAGLRVLPEAPAASREAARPSVARAPCLSLRPAAAPPRSARFARARRCLQIA